jgi:aldehyde:ferredoxin oxidoreductase
MGKICFVDLIKNEIREQRLDDKIYRSFIGGEGLGARILLEKQQAHVDALGPENMLGIIVGLLTGCGVSSAARTTVVTKSPLTGTFGDANSGGYFAPELKACGYDGIFFKGISPKPVYLLVTAEKAELKDASHLWGKDTVETSTILRQELGDSKISVACIGPAGEKMSLISSIIIDQRAAARSGVGAVMGSKRLKAIVIRGHKKIPLADPNTLKPLTKKYAKSLTETDYFVIKTLRKYGTCGLVTLGTRLGLAPAKNWSASGEEGFPAHAKLDGDNVIRFRTKRHGCADCVIRCGGIVRLDNGSHGSIETRLPEYETLVSFGNMCLNEDVQSIIKAEDFCDRYGIDTISTGNVIAFAMECFEKGFITKKETGGIELTWGNATAILAVLEQLVKREGFGALLTDGVKKAAELIGKGSDQFAVHIGGQEIPYHDFRFEPAGRGMTYISDPTPSRHERFTGGQLLQLGVPLGPEQELQPKSETDPANYQGLGQIYATGTKYYEFFVSCGMCAFAMGACATFPLVDIISAVTGWDFTAGELLKTGERIQTIRQAFNFREGVRPHDFNIPARMKEPAAFQGPMKADDFEYDYKAIRTAYHNAMRWNPETGEPSKKRLDELGLKTILS